MWPTAWLVVCCVAKRVLAHCRLCAVKHGSQRSDLSAHSTAAKALAAAAAIVAEKHVLLSAHKDLRYMECFEYTGSCPCRAG